MRLTFVASNVALAAPVCATVRVLPDWLTCNASLADVPVTLSRPVFGSNAADSNTRISRGSIMTKQSFRRGRASHAGGEPERARGGCTYELLLPSSPTLLHVLRC